MLTQKNFEKELECIGEKYFTENGGVNKARGGNSQANEQYFRFVRREILDRLKCNLLLLGKQECPDSGVFGYFNYKTKSEVDWTRVESGVDIAVEVTANAKVARYMVLPTSVLEGRKLTKAGLDEFSIHLNEYLSDDRFFGVEYKATDNKSPNAITVASFNSTCPSNTKTANIKGKIIHNIKGEKGKAFDKKLNVKIAAVPLHFTVQLYMYYFIINDHKVDGESRIQHILLVPGSFFAPAITEDEAKKFSSQLYPKDVLPDFKCERISLRYRPFFESKSIKVDHGCGLYVGWKPHTCNKKRVEEPALCYTLEELYDRVA